MTERHVLLALSAVAGIGLGALLAQLMGVTSWLDAKVFLVVGAAGGLWVAGLVGKLRK